MMFRRFARSRTFWVPERALAGHPNGAGRDYCSIKPAWSKKYGGGKHGKLFAEIEREIAQVSKWGKDR